MKKFYIVTGMIMAMTAMQAATTLVRLEFQLPEPWCNGPETKTEKQLLAEFPGVASVTLSRIPSHIRIDWRWTGGIGCGALSAMYPAIPEAGLHCLEFELDPEAGIFNGALDRIPFRRADTRVPRWKMAPLDAGGVKKGPLTRSVTICPGALQVLPEPPAETLDLGARRGRRLYHNSFRSPDACAGWKMEGPGVVKIQNGELRMHPANLEDPHAHFVYWCPEIFPADFLAEWTFVPESRYGLAILFFAARGTRGESVLSPRLAPRNGVFSQYTQSDVAAYHISYYANTPEDPGRMTTNLRKNPGFYLLSNGPAPLQYGDNRPHRVCLLKEKGRIVMTVDGRVIIDYIDTGAFGPVWQDGSFGFRQMARSVMRYADFSVYELRPRESDGE